MNAAIEEVIGELSRHEHGKFDARSLETTVANSLRLFTLHFLAFFNFKPVELVVIREHAFQNPKQSSEIYSQANSCSRKST